MTDQAKLNKANPNYKDNPTCNSNIMSAHKTIISVRGIQKA